MCDTCKYMHILAHSYCPNKYMQIHAIVSHACTYIYARLHSDKTWNTCRYMQNTCIYMQIHVHSYCPNKYMQIHAQVTHTCTYMHLSVSVCNKNTDNILTSYKHIVKWNLKKNACMCMYYVSIMSVWEGDFACMCYYVYVCVSIDATSNFERKKYMHIHANTCKYCFWFFNTYRIHAHTNTKYWQHTDNILE